MTTPGVCVAVGTPVTTCTLEGSALCEVEESCPAGGSEGAGGSELLGPDAEAGGPEGGASEARFGPRIWSRPFHFVTSSK